MIFAGQQKMRFPRGGSKGVSVWDERCEESDSERCSSSMGDIAMEQVGGCTHKCWRSARTDLVDQHIDEIGGGQFWRFGQTGGIGLPPELATAL